MAKVLELDKYMESNYLSLSKEKKRGRRNRGLANFLYVRYADDWVVLCNGTKAQALAMKEELKGVLKKMGLELSEEKTKVTHITPTASFNSLSNAPVLKGVVTSRSWLTSDTLRWSWDPTSSVSSGAGTFGGETEV